MITYGSTNYTFPVLFNEYVTVRRQKWNMLKNIASAETFIVIDADTNTCIFLLHISYLPHIIDYK